MQPAAFTLRIHTNTLPEYAMSSFAIPAAAPTTTLATTGNASAPAGNESHFGDTLRNTQSSPQTEPQGHSANNTPAAGNTSSKPDAGKQKGKQDDGHDGKSAKAKPDDQAADAQPIAAPIAAPAPAAPRQPLAADGKTLPAATASATPTVNSVAATVATAAATTITAATMQPAATPALVPATAKAAAPNTSAKIATPSEHADTTDTSDTEPTDAQGDAASATDIASILKMPARAATQTDANHDNDASADHHGPTDFANQLTQLVAAHVAQPGNAPPAPAPLQLAMQTTPDQPQQFAQETVQHVAWLAGKGIDKAEIQLNPRKLGPISIEISNHHDRVDVSFAVQHPQTVHALQQTLPQLHDMLAQHGLNLGQASVGQQAPNQQHPAFAQHFGSAASNDVGNTENEPSRNWQSSRIAMPGRVDDFA